MSCSITFIFLCGLGLSAAAGTTGRDCGAGSSGSCPKIGARDSTSLLQSRVERVDTEKDAPLVGFAKALGKTLFGFGGKEDTSAKGQLSYAPVDASGDAVLDNAEHADQWNAHGVMTPPKFLIISSTSGKKVVWTVVPDMPTEKGEAFDLIDQGLDQPKGLAFDKTRGYLYIADSGAQKIFRETLIIDTSRAKPHLSTTHTRVTIVEKCGPVEWITLDDEGNLFYSQPLTNNINKISKEVMAQLGTGEIQANSLIVVSEKTLQADQIAQIAKDKAYDKAQGPTDPPPVKAHISSIYEAKLNPHVARPAAICVDGPTLYWANQQDGIKAGSVVEGQVTPVIPSTSDKTGPVAFPAKVLTSMSSGAVGIAKAGKVIFFTQNETISGTGVEVAGQAMMVSGFEMGSGGSIINFVRGLGGARTLLWDQAQTMFVADDVMGSVFAFPTGRLMTNVPRTLIASVPGAYGLAMTIPGDPWFKANAVGSIQDFGKSN